MKKRDASNANPHGPASGRFLMRGRDQISVFGLCVFSVCLSEPKNALADPSTHEFRIVKAESTYKADCGGGQCSKACTVHARLKNIHDRSDESIDINLFVKGETRPLNFLFPSIPRGDTVDGVDHVMNMLCRQVKIERVKFSCSTDNSGRCGFVKLNIAASRRPEMKAQKISN